MRIIDKNKDFYDYLQGIYPDRLLVFDRTGSFVLTKQALCDCIPEHARRPGCFVLLQVCNTFWLYYARRAQKSDVSILEQPEYNFELVASWKNYNKQRQLLKLDLTDFSARDVFPNSRMFWMYEDNNKMAAALASVDFSEKKDLLMAAVDTDNYRVLENVNRYDTRTGWCSNLRTKYRIRIPILSSSGLVGGIDPLGMYLSIEEYLSFEKTASERTESVGLTDKERITNHGFDVKHSFRGK